MSDGATPKIRFETPTALPLEAVFDGGRLTSDGGLCWLAEMDSQLGLCNAISKHVPEWWERTGFAARAPILATNVAFIRNSSGASILGCDA